MTARAAIGYTGTVLLWQTGRPSRLGHHARQQEWRPDGGRTGRPSAVMLQDDKKGGKERVTSIGTAKGVRLRRRHTQGRPYTGDAHLTGPQGDLTSPKIELFSKPSGDELDRAEAYEAVSLRGESRKTTGRRLFILRRRRAIRRDGRAGYDPRRMPA